LTVRGRKWGGGGLHNGELHNLYTSPNIFRVIKSRRVTGAGQTRVYPKVSGLAVWIVDCKWYSSLQLVSLVSFDAITLCVASQ
jgi:hypothetical protein